MPSLTLFCLDLIKKLLPHEYHMYLMSQKDAVRADGRQLTEHRPINMQRGVLPSLSDSQSIKVSSRARLGDTLVIGQASVRPNEHTVLREQPLTVNVQLLREMH